MSLKSETRQGFSTVFGIVVEVLVSAKIMENNQYFRGKDNGKCACGWDIRVLTEVSEKWLSSIPAENSRIPEYLDF